LEEEAGESFDYLGSPTLACKMLGLLPSIVIMVVFFYKGNSAALAIRPNDFLGSIDIILGRLYSPNEGPGGRESRSLSDSEFEELNTGF
jgi:hypothetical protein